MGKVTGGKLSPFHWKVQYTFSYSGLGGGTMDVYQYFSFGVALESPAAMCTVCLIYVFTHSKGSMQIKYVVYIFLLAFSACNEGSVACTLVKSGDS